MAAYDHHTHVPSSAPSGCTVGGQLVMDLALERKRLRRCTCTGMSRALPHMWAGSDACSELLQSTSLHETVRHSWLSWHHAGLQAACLLYATHQIGCKLSGADGDEHVLANGWQIVVLGLGRQ